MHQPIGIRELKNHASRIMRSVREEMAEYVITIRGKPIAILRPLDEEERRRLDDKKKAAAISGMKSLAEQIAAQWKSPKSPVEIIEDLREE